MERGFYDYRGIAVCRDTVGAIRALRTLADQAIARVAGPCRRPVVFMFPGGGAQYQGMAAELYEFEPEFRRQIDRCAELVKPHIGLDVRSILYPGEQQEAAAAELIERPLAGLSALFVTEYALARLWESWGVSPQAVIGHSLGEYVAACIAGILSLEDALVIVALRGRLLESLQGGAMLSIGAGEDEIAHLLNEEVSLAAINGPRQCVVAGQPEAVARLERQLAAQGVNVRLLHIGAASHSRLVEPILDDFTEFAKNIRLRPPRLPCFSNVTGTWMTDADISEPGYWARHLRQPVRFADGIEELVKHRRWLLLEVGPGHTLSTLVRQHPATAKDQVVAASLPHPRDPRSDEEVLLGAVGRLWLAGLVIDWSAFSAHKGPQRVPLPHLLAARSVVPDSSGRGRSTKGNCERYDRRQP